ncbi:MAG: GAF domain-containing protein, partial [Dehalococcoidia bacterium]
MSSPNDQVEPLVEHENLQSMVGLALARDDLGELFDEIGEQARRLVDAHYAVVVSYGEDGSIDTFVPGGISDEEVHRIGQPFPRGAGVLGLLRGSSSPIVLDDVHQHPAFTGFPPGHPPMTSFLGVPIANSHGNIGAIYLANKRGARRFTVEDERRVQGLASLAGLAIERTRLLRRERHAREEAE